MKADELKAKLHAYVDNASEEALNELLLFCEDEAAYATTTQKSEFWKNKDFVKEMSNRANEIENGTVKGFSLEEAKEEIDNFLKTRKSK